jgi:tetratricopeptide (TPR) repeat protein
MDKNMRAMKNSLPPLKLLEEKKDEIEIKEDSFYNPSLHDIEEEYNRYTQMIQKGEINKNVLFRIGRINHFRGKFDEAYKYYNKALELDQNDGEIHYNLGNIYLKDGKLEEAKEEFLKSIDANQRDVYALNALGKVYLKAREFFEAEKYHRMALEINPEDVYALRGLGDISLIKDRVWYEINEKTIESVKDRIIDDKFKIVESLKNSMFSKEELTNILINLNFKEEEIKTVENCSRRNYIEALSYYYRALEINPYEKITLHNIGLVHFLSGQIEKSEQHYRDCLQKIKDFPGFYFGLSLCYYRQDRKIDAFKNYGTGLSIAQDSPEYIFFSGNYHEISDLTLPELEEEIKKLREDFIKEEKKKPLLPLTHGDYGKKQKEPVMSPVSPITLELGRSLLLLVDPNQGSKLLERINSIRRHIISELGLILPGVRFKDSYHINSNGYIMKIYDREVAYGEIFLDKLLAVGPEHIIDTLKGYKCKEPGFGMPAIWIEIQNLKEAEEKKCMIFEPLSVIATHITEVIRKYAPHILGRQEVAHLLKFVEKTHPALVKEVYPHMFSLGELKKILKNLLAEDISIRNLPSILETLGDYSTITDDTDELTLYVRQSLASARKYQNQKGEIEVFSLDGAIERELLKSIERHIEGNILLLDDTSENLLVNALEGSVKSFCEKEKLPLLFCNRDLLMPIKRLIRKTRFPLLHVICPVDIPYGVTVTVIETITILSEDFLAFKNFTGNRNIFSYIEKLHKASEPEIRIEAVNLLMTVAGEHNINRVFDYIDKALEDEEESVRIHAAQVMSQIVDKMKSEWG